MWFDGGGADSLVVVLKLLAVLVSVLNGFDDAQEAAWVPFVDDL